MPRLFAKRLEVLYRARVGRVGLEHLASPQLRQGLLAAQNRERAFESAGVQFLVKVHDVLFQRCQPKASVRPS